MATLQPVNEQLGYYFHPSTATAAVGHPQLDVVLRPDPTGEHFDPLFFLCQAADGKKSTPLHVQHPWHQDTSYRICTGEIVIEGQRHSQVTAFTFGGTLRIDSDSRRTVCQLSSSAPILEHSQRPDTLEERLSEEVNILFAERRAAQDEDAFAGRMAAADPAALYHACLAALLEKFQAFPPVDELQRRFKQFLHAAAQEMPEENGPALADLL